MSKAEERALEKYPIEMYKEVGWRCIDKNVNKRKFFVEGYQQAEKDLELTWKDIGIILKISPFVDEQHCDNNREFCEEVLKRFKDMKNGTTKRRIQNPR